LERFEKTLSNWPSAIPERDSASRPKPRLFRLIQALALPSRRFLAVSTLDPTPVRTLSNCLVADAELRSLGEFKGGQLALRMLSNRKVIRACLKGGLLLTTIAFGLSQEASATTPAPGAASLGNPGASVPPLILSGRQSTRPAGTYSAGVAEILQMLDTKLDAPVILAYIQNSSILYNLDAADLIALKDHGASADLLMAILHHADELRLRLAQVLYQVNPSPAVTPAYDYASEPPSPAYPVTPYSDSGAALYPPATFYSYGCAWPWLWRSSFCNGYRSRWYNLGPWYAHCDDAHNVCGGHGAWATANASGWPGQRQAFATSSGHASTPAARSGLVRTAARSGGHAGTRSR